MRGLAFLLALASVGACTCGADTVRRKCPFDDQICCETDADCPDRYECVLPDGATEPPMVCSIVPRTCESDADCCPGQRCNSVQFCADSVTECSAETACTIDGQACKPFPPGCQGDKCIKDACQFKPCQNQDDCGEGLFCFNKYCIGDRPCSGGCSAGKVCVVANNKCFPAPDNASCKQTCGAGFQLVLRDPFNVFDLCDKNAVECECEELPPLRVNDVARHSSLAVGTAAAFAAAYDGEHGDLVVHQFSKASPFKLLGSEWVDGVPETGAVIAGPSGPRRGIADAGPNVGRYTALQLTAQEEPMVAYFDVDNKDLKFAGKFGGTWKIYTLDSTGAVGEFAAMTKAPGGEPAIAYFQRGGEGANKFMTGVKFARAKVAKPQSAADWNIASVDTGERPHDPCDGECTEAQVCTVTGSLQQCEPTAPSCPASCASDESCVAQGAGGACKKVLRPSGLVDVPDGNGLWPAVAYLDDKPVLVWYDRLNGALKGTVATSDGASGTSFGAKLTIDGRNRSFKKDVGWFPAIAIGPSNQAKRFAVAYQDAQHDDVLLLLDDNLYEDARANRSGTIQIVDPGKSDPAQDGWLVVGGDTQVAWGADGPVVAYQDQTRGDLMFAKPSGNTWERTAVRSEGAVGFWASMQADGTKFFISHALIKATGSSEVANKLLIEQVE